jgi:hypothetical protein
MVTSGIRISAQSTRVKYPLYFAHAKPPTAISPALATFFDTSYAHCNQFQAGSDWCWLCSVTIDFVSSRAVRPHRVNTCLANGCPLPYPSSGSREPGKAI